MFCFKMTLLYMLLTLKVKVLCKRSETSNLNLYETQGSEMMTQEARAYALQVENADSVSGIT